MLSVAFLSQGKYCPFLIFLMLKSIQRALSKMLASFMLITTILWEKLN